MALVRLVKDIIKRNKYLKNNDYSFVENKDTINMLVTYGKLVPLYLMPLRFNGEDTEKNKVYVPKTIIELKDKADNMIEDLIKKGKLTVYSCNLDYKGKSLVPSSITVIGKKDKEEIFSEKINIW